MEFPEKVSLTFTVLQILEISVSCLNVPQTLSNNPYETGPNFLEKSQSTSDSIWTGILDNDYSVASSSNNKVQNSNSALNQNFGSSSRYSNFPSCNKNNFKNKITTNTKNEQTLAALLPEFSSAPNYRDISNFPEVEYPLHVSDIWKPNYWSSFFSDQPSNNLGYSSVCTDEKRNPKPIEDNIMTNLGKRNKVGPSVPLITKSFSDPVKNILQLRSKLANNKGKNNEESAINICDNYHTKLFDDTENIQALGILSDNTNVTSNLSQTSKSLDLRDFYTTYDPYYFTPYTTPIPTSTCSLDTDSNYSDNFSIKNKDLSNTLESKVILPSENKIKKSQDKILDYDNDFIALSSLEDTRNKISPESDKNIINYDDYTTGDPEYEESYLSANVYSTLAPHTLTASYLNWQDTKVLENLLKDSDELKDYFICV